MIIKNKQFDALNERLLNDLLDEIIRLAHQEMELTEAIISKGRALIEHLDIRIPALGLDMFKLVRTYPDHDLLSFLTNGEIELLFGTEEARVETFRLAVVRYNYFGPNGK